jgi:hypothetical protein
LEFHGKACGNRKNYLFDRNSVSSMPGAKQGAKKIGVIKQNKGVLAEEGHY